MAPESVRGTQLHRLLAVLGVLASMPTMADYLLLSGETYWNGSLYGHILLPTGYVLDIDDVDQVLMGRIIDDDDTIVLDTAGQIYEVFESISPSELIESNDLFTAYDMQREGSVYFESEGAFACAPIIAELDAEGALIHFGTTGHVLCDDPARVLSPPGDRDGDSLLDVVDNCPKASNVDQHNTDGDEKGDACDIDDDNDGLSDTLELLFGTIPWLADSDGDNLNDREELLARTDPTNADSDGDGIPDGEELAEGFDPLDDSDCSLQYCRGISSALIRAIRQNLENRPES